jgi:hypothetical protein
MTPSGLIAIKVCSVDILFVSGSRLGELKKFVTWKASAVVITVRRKVVMTRKSLGMRLKIFVQCTCTIAIVTTGREEARALNRYITSSFSASSLQNSNWTWILSEVKCVRSVCGES